MICKVRNTIERYSMLQGVKSVAVGVSGGADSMCLLHILNTLKDEYGYILKAVHINHNLRGEEALRDENFVRAFCCKEQIELVVHSKDIRSLAKEKGLCEEECGRVIRYECFDKAGCDVVAVAHSLTDSIETLVFNMIRGTGVKGLCGIPAKREPNIIRPLIECTRCDIEKYCTDNSLEYITDSSNLTDDYTRNFIRHNIVGKFSGVNQGFENNFLSLMNIVAVENDYISEQAKALMFKCKKEKGYDAHVLKGAHQALRKRVISLILNELMQKSVASKHIELVDDIIVRENGQVEIAKDLYICVDNGIMYSRCNRPLSKIDPVGFKDGVAYSDCFRFLIEEIAKENYNADSLFCFDGDKIKGELVLTSRQSGDKFTFKRRNVSKTLKKLFNEMKIPEEQRDLIYILRDENDIIWVEKVGVNAAYLPDKDTQKYFLIKKEVQ